MATADLIRIVELRNFTAFPILDLSDNVTYTPIKDGFQTARPQKSRTTVGGARRYDGDKVAFEKMGNASITMSWYIGPLGGTQDQAIGNVERLGQALEEAIRANRLIEVRFAGATRSTFYEPRGTPDWTVTGYDSVQFLANGVIQATATIPVAPTCNGAPMDVEDHFLTDSVTAGDWIKDGAAALQVLGTNLAPNGLGIARYRHARGYPYQDVELRFTFTLGATITNGRWGVFWSANQSGVDTKMAFEMDQAAAQCQLVTYVAGARTVIQNFSAGVPTAGFRYEMRVLRQGDVIRVAFQQMNSVANGPPTFAFSDYTTTFYAHTYDLTGSQLGFQAGDCGIQVTSVDAGERYDDFAIRPFSYYGVAMPEQMVLTGEIPGAAPAAVDFEITTNDAGAVGQAPIWALAAWSERPLVSNLLRNGDFEAAVTAGLEGWAHSALTNYVTNAATSHAQDTNASRYGASELGCVTPASTQSGVWAAIPRRCKRNRQYAAFCWAKATVGTTSAAIKLGATGLGGVSVGTAKNLSTAWQLYAVTYRPSADFDGMVVAFATQAATATTFQIDGVVVVEVPTITLSAAIASTSATACQPYFTPPDVPFLRPDGSITGPFLFLIDSEMIRCTAINPTTGIWTIERGVEYTTAATHAVDAPIILCPPLQPHLEGRGASPAFGIIEGEDYVPGLSQITGGSGSITAAADTTARGQQCMLFTATGGAATAKPYWYIDPNTIAPDDFTAGEVDVEIFARVSTTTGIAMSLITQVEPTERFSGLVLAGRRRYSREFSSVSRTIVAPSSGTRYRLTKIGTFPMIVDRSNPQRWRLVFAMAQSAANGWAVDYLMVHPTRYRACPGTRYADDGGATFPNFFPPDPNWGTGSALTKILRADMTALIRNPIPDSGRYNTLPPAFPDHGLAKQLALPTGAVDVVFKLSDAIPDDPTVNTAADMSGGASASWGCTFRAMVTPRYFVGRGGY